MRFRDVVLETLVHELPPRVLTSAELEQRLRPLYERLRLPEGRLELMTGIRERRFWPDGTRPSDASAAAARRALASTGVPQAELAVLVHAAVSRDLLEPATASFVHRMAGLPDGMQLFDLSNACLGFLNACTVLGAMIDAGQIRAGLIVCGEHAGPLVERTIARLLQGDLDRQAIKPFFANFTIGSGAVAAVLCHRSLARPGAPRLLGGVARTATRHSELCRGDHAPDAGLEMQTDSEALLVAGVELARETWREFTAETGWGATEVDRFVCHQVGVRHRRALHEALGLPPERDFSTFETLGNTGSVALPVSLSLGREQGFIAPGHRVALLGIGSGINCLMLALQC